jgi:hypothetical protein
VDAMDDMAAVERDLVSRDTVQERGVSTGRAWSPSNSRRLRGSLSGSRLWPWVNIQPGQKGSYPGVFSCLATSFAGNNSVCDQF